MKFLPFLFLFALALLLLELAERQPLEDHDGYMETEYGEYERLMVFMRKEEEIDLFLLKLENK